MGQGVLRRTVVVDLRAVVGREGLHDEGLHDGEDHPGHEGRIQTVAVSRSAVVAVIQTVVGHPLQGLRACRTSISVNLWLLNLLAKNWSGAFQFEIEKSRTDDDSPYQFVYLPILGHNPKLLN